MPPETVWKAMVKKGKRSTPYSYFSLPKKDRPTLSFIIEMFVSFNQQQLVKTSCTDHLQGRGCMCNCLWIFGYKTVFQQAVAEFQVMFGMMEGNEKKKLLIEWMKQQGDADPGNWMFPVPFIIDMDTDTWEEYIVLKRTQICRNALLELLGQSKAWWWNCAKHAKQNTVPGHKLKGKPSNRQRSFNFHFRDDLIDHFENLKKEAGPIPTRFVREITGLVTLRDTDDKAKYLPPYLTKRGCYASFCLERGVKITTDNRGCTIETPADDKTDVQNIPSFSAYLSFWNREYDDLKVSRPAEDICAHCFKFYNKHKYSKTAFNGVVDDSTLVIDNAGAADAVDKAAVVSIDDDTLSNESDILKAAIHVEQARAQRKLVNTKTEQARADRMNDVSHPNRTYTFIADYCQNLALPHFGQTQPGDTYYLTPLSLYVFGVVDVSHVGNGAEEEQDHLYAHIYKEGTGEKGGNNVCSLLVKTLKHLKLMEFDKNNKAIKGKELNIIMDNCGGQNKNNHVILLAPYLVEIGFFETVNIIFLITGHTKNVCDRRFNNLKHTYHKKQIYTMKQAVEACSESSFVTVIPVDPSNDWYDYHTMWLQIYTQMSKCKPTPLKIQMNHIFSCSKATRSQLMLSTRVADLDRYKNVSAEITNPSFKVSAYQSRQQLLKECTPNRIVYAGIPEYKQVKLYKGFSHFIPEQYWSDVCPKPDDATLKREEADQKKRREEKLNKKKKRKSIESVGEVLSTM